MKTLRLYPSNINRPYIDEITSTIDNGGCIIFPTDSLYALGCDCLDHRAIERLCKAKSINPAKHLLSIVCSDISQASGYAHIDNKAFSILRKYLPGPFTFILPASSSLPKAFRGRRTVGIRVPDNAIAREIANSLDRPLMATSIATDGLEAGDIEEPMSIASRYEGTADIMADGGAGECIPSTIVDLTDSNNPVILRQGKGIFEE